MKMPFKENTTEMRGTYWLTKPFYKHEGWTIDNYQINYTDTDNTT